MSEIVDRVEMTALKWARMAFLFAVVVLAITVTMIFKVLVLGWHG